MVTLPPGYTLTPTMCGTLGSTGLMLATSNAGNAGADCGWAAAARYASGAPSDRMAAIPPRVTSRGMASGIQDAANAFFGAIIARHRDSQHIGLTGAALDEFEQDFGVGHAIGGCGDGVIVTDLFGGANDAAVEEPVKGLAQSKAR